MSDYLWKAAHVTDASLLPKVLVKGRAYFVDSEQVILVDHGDGPVSYGGIPGPQGPAGGPTDQIESQLDRLAAASTTTSSTLWEIWQRTLQHFKDAKTDLDAYHGHMDSVLEDLAGRLQYQVDKLADASQLLSIAVFNKFINYDKQIKRIKNAITKIHPAYEWPEDKAIPERLSDLLDDEVFSTESGTWRIDETLLPDGTLMLELISQDPLDNQTLATPYGSWEIQETPLADGTVEYSLTLHDMVIENGKVGYKLNAGDKTYMITDYHTDGTAIALTLSEK